MLQIQRAFAAVLLVVFPRAHESVLEDGQLVGVVTYIVQQLLNQASLDLFAADLDRPLDGQAALFAVQSRDEVLTLIDGLGQAAKL